MICPNCAREMEHVARHGIVLDRCEVCGGVWLDRGELEHLMEAVRAPVIQPEPDPAPRRMPTARRAAPAPRHAAPRQWDDDHPRKSGKKKAKRYKQKYSTSARIKYLLKELLD
ncbi:MAG: TFIIB-type zinc ribbon-containing protein [Maritimibacter harenae]|uniref:Transcription factor zinc-finger domain-containing protein n=1 Tax=Maritimibacter harenae TaxID=2606218 RepID=A0A845M8K0_9RHOB|nr:zf-TFIIB domain-containing protein [Maritimibacter harenae]MZR12611.1 hypothetical protein [Maritimibacter harenae]